MLLRRFTDFILQSRLHSMGTAFVLSILPFGGTVSILIVGLVTLRKGMYEGSLVLLASTLPYVFLLMRPTGETQLVFNMVGLVIISNILTWLFAVVLCKYSNWNFTLELAVMLGIIVVGMTHVFYPNLQDWWGMQVTRYLSNSSAMLEITKSQDISSKTQAQVVDVIKKYATSFLTTMVLLNALLQLLVARWWQAAMFNPGGLRIELHHIRLGYVTGVIFAVGLLLSCLGNSIVIDMMPILYLTFFAAGLSLIHALASLTKAAWIWLGVVYVVVLLLFPYSVPLLAMLALIDTWVDFRKKVSVQGK